MKHHVEIKIDGIVYKLSHYEYDIWTERAAIMEYDGGLSRDDAEREALKLLLKLENKNV